MQLSLSIMPDTPTTTAPPQQFLAHIHRRWQELRGGDKLPESVDEWTKAKQQLREKLLESWGGFPKNACELAPLKLGELVRDDYRVEKIVFQTRPGVFMTANAYVPAGEGKRPAVLCVHGHWKGAKQDPVPQSRCIGLAKLGFFVLMVDAFGAGERGIGTALGEYHGEMVGSTLFPVGLPLSGLQVYENMRAVDYLLTRPEVDGSKLGITGASGGGNQTMYAGAFDERFSCVVPVCSVGTYRSYLGAACCVCEVVPEVMTYTEEWGLLAMVAPRALMVINATKDVFQFSVGEAQQSLARAQHMFRLYGQAGKVAHTIFESGHDYGKAMREAMYGWMTLHLKGEGLGNPIPEPALTVEDPETLRCYPGDTRPANFVTLPRFAAAEAAKLIDEHNRENPQHAAHWNNTAMRMRHALEHQVLGGFPTRRPEVVYVPKEKDAISATIQFETEPGVEVACGMIRGRDNPKRWVVVVDLEGIEHARATELVKALEKSGVSVAIVEPRATGRFAVAGDKIYRAPDHNSAEWAILTGRPLLGQWIWDVRMALDRIARQEQVEFEGVTLIGLGPAGVVALGTAIFEPRIARVAMIDTLASFQSDVPYVNQRMGIMAPRILRDAGDVPNLAALIAPRRLTISGAVTGGGAPLPESALVEQFDYTKKVYRLLGVEAHLSVTVAEVDDMLARRLLS
jgi:cephalosporin-C deacetylase-like acetyl esterase